MGSSVFPMGSACCLMGSEALSHYLRWAPHGLLLGSCVFAGVCNGLCVGGYWASMGSSWAPVFLRVFAVGSRMGSSWAPVFLQLLVVGSRMGSSWASVFFPTTCGGLPHGLLLGSCIFAGICGGLPHGLLLGSCVLQGMVC